MRAIYQEGRETAFLLRRILRATELEPEDLARLINTTPATVERWLSGAFIDLGCSHILLNLLDKHMDDVFYMLAERANSRKPGPSWAGKLTAIQNKFGLSKTGMVELLNTQYPAFTKWMRRETEPTSCYQPLIDLLYTYPDRMMELLARPEEPRPEEWSGKRVRALLAHLGMTSGELMGLLAMSPSTFSEWFHGEKDPGPCASIMLWLLERFPKNIVKMIREVDLDPPEFWDGARVRAAREAAGLGVYELARIYGTDHETMAKYEKEGLPEKGCPLVFYALLESRPKEFLKLIADLEIPS